MAETDSNCSSYFDGCDEKTRNLSAVQIFRKLITKTAAGCASLRVNASVTGTFAPSSTARKATRVTKTVGSYSSTAGARSVSFETSDDFTGSILGVAAQPSRAYTYEVKQNDDTLAAMAYIVTAGSIIIGELN